MGPRTAAILRKLRDVRKPLAMSDKDWSADAPVNLSLTCPRPTADRNVPYDRTRADRSTATVCASGVELLGAIAAARLSRRWLCRFHHAAASSLDQGLDARHSSSFAWRARAVCGRLSGSFARHCSTTSSRFSWESVVPPSARAELDPYGGDGHRPRRRSTH